MRKLKPLNLSVGDKVTHLEYGHGVVKMSLPEDIYKYVIYFELCECFMTFTEEGRFDRNSPSSALFPGHVKLTVTASPVYETRYINIWCDDAGALNCSLVGHETPEAAEYASKTNKSASDHIAIAQPIKVPV